jgi:predicted DNA-binding transcriptional regulator AlpA
MDSVHHGVTGRKAFSINEFCIDHGISRATFYNLKRDGKAPALMTVNTRKLISVEAAAAWRARMEAESAEAAACECST